jgi:hypothetical protein
MDLECLKESSPVVSFPRLLVQSHCVRRCTICEQALDDDEETVAVSISSGKSLAFLPEWIPSSEPHDPWEWLLPQVSRPAQVPPPIKEPLCQHITKRQRNYSSDGHSSCSTLVNDRKNDKWPGSPEHPFIPPGLSITPFDEDWFTLDQQILDFRCRDQVHWNSVQDPCKKFSGSVYVLSGGAFTPQWVDTGWLWSSLLNLVHPSRNHK